ncbi:DUF4189 domain-containing protein [Xanthomonas hydrangeae]|nr:DUF4189 domain-containing protein [Xanthomonas hydrangeae]
MKIPLLLICLIATFTGNSYAEGGCPPGQYPIGGQGAISCAPLPQAAPQRPIGKWVDSWGAIAMGSMNSITTYGVTTGKSSKSDAVEDALTRCSSHGETNCRIGLAYKNQCAAVAEPQTNGLPFADGFSAFMGASSVARASMLATEKCRKGNSATPNAQCKVVYTACSEATFEKF